MRKLIANVTTAAVLLSQVAFVGAATNYTSVANTAGSASVNTSSNETVSVGVVNTNVAVVSQETTQMNNTGGIVANGNISLGPCGECTGAGSTVATGSINSTSSNTADVNHNTTAIEVSGAGSANNTTDVVNTGNQANVNTNANSDVNVGVMNYNNALVDQQTTQLNSTGGVAANNNIGPVGIVTGGVTSGASNSLSANTNMTAVSVAPSMLPTTTVGGCFGCALPCTGGNCTSVVNSGRNLNLNSSTTSNVNVGVMNSNMLFARQFTGQMNNTGMVVTNNNIGGTMVGTGGITAGAANALSGNTNTTGIAVGETLMPMGAMNLLDLVNTGVNAQVSANSNTNTNTGAVNGNLFFGSQSSTAGNSTGFYMASSNIGYSVATTGSVNSGSTSTLGVNQNNTFYGSPLALFAWLGLMTL